LMKVLTEYEARKGHQWSALGRRSPDPRVVNLRELLKAGVHLGKETASAVSWTMGV
jgi:hypothetical protein